MLVNELINPNSIVVVGGSNDISKPGGRVLKNLIDWNYDGKLFVINPKEDEIQGIKCNKTVDEIETAELAIMAIPAKFIPVAMEQLAKEKGTKAFIVLSAGFSEMGSEGKKLENEMLTIMQKYGCTLIGPNCIGVITNRYKGVFAGPIPKPSKFGCDFVSSSGATVVFILEVAIPRGISFANIFSIGNGTQISVEDILEYWDETYEAGVSSNVKLIYTEQISNPVKFLKHSRSLINKGCKIAAIKAGTTEAGSRAVSSHTGALAGSDTAVDALLKKAGIVRCYSRVELVYVAGVFLHKSLTGDRIAVITHAGGSGVMLTDTLTKEGLQVPPITGKDSEELLSKLNYGSSVSNPIDFIATGTAEQLGIILDYVDEKFDNIDGSAVIFGTTGMFDVTGVYDVLDEKMKTCKKPIFPVLPPVVQAAKAVNHFLSLGRINFTDEVSLGHALTKVYKMPKPDLSDDIPHIDVQEVRRIIDSAQSGYLSPDLVQGLIDAAGIPRIIEYVTHTLDEAINDANKIGYPIALKVVGPVHKTDVGGVILNIKNQVELSAAFQKIIKIEGATGVLIQKMMQSGIELFIGAKQEPKFGHIIVCGLGGVFIEVFKDISYGLAPVGPNEAHQMISRDRKSVV